MELENARGAQCGMPCKGKLFFGGENSNTNALSGLHGGSTTLHERCLAKVELARNGLHALGRKPDGVKDHCQRISRQRGFSKNIDDKVIQFSHRGTNLRLCPSLRLNPPSRCHKLES